MRILQTTFSYRQDGGVGRVVSSVARRLAALGHEVHVATGADEHADDEEAARGVFVHQFRVRGNAAIGYGGDVHTYREFVTSGRWDVVIMHCAQIWSTDVLLPCLGQLSGGKIFVGHGFSALNNPAYRSYFGSLAHSLREFQQVFTLSPLLEEIGFCRLNGIAEPIVVPNGVDPEEWKQESLGMRSAWNIGSAPWILSLSNHSTVKGHPLFWNCVREIRKVLPAAKGTIIGGHYPAARWNVGSLGIKGGCWYECGARALFQDAVSLRRNEPRRRVVSAVQEADVALITSSREASPLVVLECMAAGTPWVSLDVGCVRENSGGVIVSSAEEMVSVTLALLKDPQRRERLAAEGRSAALEHHGWDGIAALYEKHCFAAMAAASRQLGSSVGC